MMVSYLKKTISVIAAILFPGAVCGYLAAQDTDSLLYRADSLRKAYLFSESVSLYDRILSMTEDSLSRIAVQDSKMLSENGLGMTDFVYQPTVVARHRFSMEDFYLYYPLEDKSWRPLPNVLDTIGKHPFYKAVYFPENSRTLYYSAPDQWIAVPSCEGAASSLVFGRDISVYGVPEAPGSVIAKAPELRARNISNPSLMILEDGSYLAGCTGADPTGNTFFRSYDKGATWTRISNPGYMNFGKVFSKDGRLYELGVSDSGCGNIVIRMSEDFGATWSGTQTLFAGNYHSAPTPFVECDGRLWHAMGTKNDNEMMGIFVMSLPLQADPMTASSWTMSNTIVGNRSWLDSGSGHVFNQWQEGCVVRTPSDELKIVTRIDDSLSNDIMAIIDVEDANTISFDPASGFHIMPGAGKKFTIMYDEPSAKYWAVTTPVFDEDRTRRHSGWYSEKILPIFLRSHLALCSSPDLETWSIEKLVVTSDNVFFHGFQYADWVIDGNDMVALCRTAFSESRGLPNRQHDANMLTVHRLHDFRSCGFDTEYVNYDQID